MLCVVADILASVYHQRKSLQQKMANSGTNAQLIAWKLSGILFIIILIVEEKYRIDRHTKQRTSPSLGPAVSGAKSFLCWTIDIHI